MGLTVIDAGVLIGVLDRSDPHHAVAAAALRDARERGDELRLPASAYAELLVGPTRRGREAVEKVERFLHELPATVADLSPDVARAAAALRARLGSRLRLPDALVVATAQVLRADRLLTTDRAWPPRSRLAFRGVIEVVGRR